MRVIFYAEHFFLIFSEDKAPQRSHSFTSGLKSNDFQPEWKTEAIFEHCTQYSKSRLSKLSVVIETDN